MKAEDAEARLRALADEETAAGMLRFFKTGPGQYGEGDRFLGIKADPLKRLARECRGLSLGEAEKLLGSAFHEARMLALLVLVGAFEKGDEGTRQAVYDLYMGNTARVNNWDLVDASAPAIVGNFLTERDRGPLTRLAGSTSLWERRIAVGAVEVVQAAVLDAHPAGDAALSGVVREAFRPGRVPSPPLECLHPLPPWPPEFPGKVSI